MGVELKGVFGALDDVILLTFVVILGILGIFAYTMGLPGVLKLHMTDINTISEASTYGDYLENDFIPMALNLSEQRAARELGERGGEVAWTRSNIPFSDVVNPMSDPYAREIEREMDGYLHDAGKAIRCSIDASYTAVSTREKTTLKAENPVVHCETPRTMAEYNMSGKISTPLSTNYYQLGENFQELALEARENLPGEKITEKAVESIDCEKDGISASERSGADARAAEEARQEATGGLGDADENARSEADLDTGIKYVSGSTSFYPAATGAEKISSEVQECQVRVGCEDSTEDTCDPYVDGEKYTTEYSYTLDRVEVSFTVRDEQEKILAANGAEHLEFSATYRHPLN